MLTLRTSRYGREDLQRVAQFLQLLLIQLNIAAVGSWSRSSLSALATISPTMSPSGTLASCSISRLAVWWTPSRSARESWVGDSVDSWLCSRFSFRAVHFLHSDFLHPHTRCKKRFHYKLR